VAVGGAAFGQDVPKAVISQRIEDRPAGVRELAHRAEFIRRVPGVGSGVVLGKELVNRVAVQVLVGNGTGAGEIRIGIGPIVAGPRLRAVGGLADSPVLDIVGEDVVGYRGAAGVFLDDLGQAIAVIPGVRPLLAIGDPRL